MSLEAIIFDVDGTLIDTNAAHVDAWLGAFASHGYPVSRDRIETEIGKGGDKLVADILGRRADEYDGAALRDGHDLEYSRIARSTRLGMFPGVDALLLELRRKGIRLAAATSSKRSELAVTAASAGVDLEELFEVIATVEDARESDSSPDVLRATLSKLELTPAQCAMIGNTRFDVEACRDAGVVCLGVTGGGNSEERNRSLREAGARAVYRDLADLLEHLDEALRLASPGKVSFTQAAMEWLMREALAVAEEGMKRGEVPIGCVIATGDGTIVARGYNGLNRTQNKTAHAEMVAFEQAAGKAPADARDMILVSTLEPCVMCLGASMEAAVDTIVFALEAPMDGGRGRVQPPLSPESQMPRIVGGVMRPESRRLLERFLELPDRNPEQIKFVRQLLNVV